MCVSNKIDDGTTAKAAHLSWSKNLLFERRGDHNVFEENLSACHVVARNIGHRLSLLAVILSGTRRYCKRKGRRIVNPCEVEPFFDRVRRKKAREWLAHEPRDLQKDYM